MKQLKATNKKLKEDNQNLALYEEIESLKTHIREQAHEIQKLKPRNEQLEVNIVKLRENKTQTEQQLQLQMVNQQMSEHSK